MSGNMYLAKDIWAEDTGVALCSGAGGPQIKRVIRGDNNRGRALVRGLGQFMGKEEFELIVQVEEVGNLSNTIAALQCIPSEPLEDPQNKGDGSCVCQTAATMVVPYDIKFIYDGVNTMDVEVWDSGTYAGGATVSTDTCLVDGAFHAIVGGTLQAKFTQGDQAFANNDVFWVYCRQCNVEYSRDGGVTFETPVIPVLDSGGGWQTPAAVVDFIYGMKLKWTMGKTSKGFFLADVFYVLGTYKNGLNKLASQRIFDKFRTRRADRQMLLRYLTEAKEVDLLAMLWHNLTVNTTIVLLALDDTDIEMCYGDAENFASGGGSSTFDVYTQTALTLNIMINGASGKIYFSTGETDDDFQGRYFVVTANTAGIVEAAGRWEGWYKSEVTVTDASNELQGTDANRIASWVFEPNTGSSLVAYQGSVQETFTITDWISPVNNGAALGYSARGWIVVIDDSTNADGEFSMSFNRMGERDYLTAANGRKECNEFSDRGKWEAYQRALDTLANIPDRAPQGLPKIELPIIYNPIQYDAYDDFEALWRYCNELNRARSVIFWEDFQTLTTFVMGWLGPVTPGKINSMHARITTSIRTFETT